MFDTTYGQHGWIRVTARAEDVTNEAIERAGTNANPTWREAAEAAVYRVCKRHEFFVSEDVWQELGAGEQTASTHEPRALGAVMRQAARLGYCVATERWQKTQRVAAHRRPQQVWRSLIWDEVA